MSAEPGHKSEETTGERQGREARSVGWLIFRDQDLRLLVGLPATAVLGVAMLIAGLTRLEVWMIVIGSIFALVSVGGLIAILVSRSRR